MTTKAQRHEQRIEALCQRLADLLSGVQGGNWGDDWDRCLFDDGLLQPPEFGKWLYAIESVFFTADDGKLIDTGTLFWRGSYGEWSSIRAAAVRVAEYQDRLKVKGATR